MGKGTETKSSRYHQFWRERDDIPLSNQGCSSKVGQRSAAEVPGDTRKRKNGSRESRVNTIWGGVIEALNPEPLAGEMVTDEVMDDGNASVAESYKSVNTVEARRQRKH